MGITKNKIQFYRSIATLEEAGVPILRALKQRHPGPYRWIAPRMITMIEQGEGSLGDVAKHFPRYFSNLECQLMKVGETTGQLSKMLSHLAEWFELQRELKKVLISGITYPLFLYHFAAIAIPFIQWLVNRGPIETIFIQIACFLGPLYLFAGIFFISKAYLPPVYKIICVIALYIPVLGGALRKLEIARFFQTYGMAMDAGISTANAITLATAACNNVVIRGQFLKAERILRYDGSTFGEAYAKINQNSMAAEMLLAGEMSGKGAESAMYIAKTFRDEGEESLRRFISLAPKLFYICIVIYVGYSVVTLFMKMFSQQINSIRR